MTIEGKYTVLDNPMVLACLFHPRTETSGRPERQGREDFQISVGDGVYLGASLHFHAADAPVVVFFHGNGEIVSDYDDLGDVFARGAGVNFFVTDYRGYGTSSGEPTVTAMMADAHRVLGFVEKLMADRGLTGPLCIMGRSLGSAPAIELAACQTESGPIHSLIVESGFALSGPLLRVLGLDPDRLGFTGIPGYENLDKIGRVTCPCLVIHAQFDHLIPFSDGQALYDACPSSPKHLLEIKGANHNDIFLRGMTPYLEQVRRFCRP
ncbi:MAG TPA: alpha/beta hydrolase [Desulfobacteraceae bacterium]|nr:alpha/beta hydrolase [Desulfobacteraceae bacterium]